MSTLTGSVRPIILEKIKVRLESRVTTLRNRLADAKNADASADTLGTIRYELAAAERRLDLLNEKVTTGRT